MYPPDDPFLINTSIFGIHVAIRWYAVAILSGVMVAGWVGSKRARHRGYNPDHVWNALMLGLILGVLFARLWYVAFEWQRFQGASLITILNPATGGLAIHGALLGGALAVAIYTRRHKLNLLDWLDITAVGFPIAQAIGRWGNFFNQEAYGVPMSNPRPWGLYIDDQFRVDPYRNFAEYPESTLFHPTFLYESLWNLIVFASLLTVEWRFAGRLRRGDTALLYGVLYSVGRFFIEDLRVDKLCTGGAGGLECADGLSTARLVSLLLIAICSAILVGRRLLRPNPPAEAYQPLGRGWSPEQEQAQQSEAVSAEVDSQASEAELEAQEERPDQHSSGTDSQESQPAGS